MGTTGQHSFLYMVCHLVLPSVREREVASESELISVTYRPCDQKRNSLKDLYSTLLSVAREDERLSNLKVDKPRSERGCAKA